MKSMVLLAVLMVGSMRGAHSGESVKAEWGSISKIDEPELSAWRVLRVEKWPADGSLAMPVPFPNILKAWVLGKEGPRQLRWSFNEDASEINVVGGAEAVFPPKKTPAEVYLLTAEKSGKLEDGVIVLSALDSKVVGEKAKLETHPGNHRIGFWVNGDDYVEWELEIGGAAGKYDVELVYSRAGKSGAEAAVQIGDETLPVTLETTGSWYVYQVQPIGEVELATGGKLEVKVKSTKQIGAVMNLKAVLLHPADG